MRLRSLTVQNYRLHRDKTVEFDDSRTLIGGPNEVGKSTLVEALHRVLFLKAKVIGDLRKEMESDRQGGAPKVKLTFHKDGSLWEVTKAFRGATGTTELIQNGAKLWHNEAAEEQLAGLFGLDQPKKVTKNWLETQWLHLWVWQGQSGMDPSSVVGAKRNTLVIRLQSEGLGAVMKSDFDLRVMERVKRMRDEWFTEKDCKVRAGSKLHEAQERSTKAKERLTKAEETMQKLEDAVRKITAAESAKVTALQTLPGFKAELSQVEDKLKRVNELHNLRTQQERDLRDAEVKLEALLNEQRRYEELKVQLELSEASLKPLQEAKLKLEADHQNASKTLAEYHQQYRQAELEVRQARQLVDAAQSLMQFLSKQQNVDELRKRVADVQQTRSEWKKVQDELACQPQVAEKDLVRLRRLEAELNLAIAKRDSMAAGIQLMELAEGMEVRVGGRVLQRGEKLSLTEDTEIEVGVGTRLQLSPGGGGKVEEAKREVELAHSELHLALSKMVVADLEQAARLVARVGELKVQEQRLREKLELLGGDKLEKTLEILEQELKSLESDWTRRSSLLDGHLTVPTNLADTQQWLKESRSVLEGLESKEQLARKIWEDGQDAEKLLEQQLQQERAKLEEQKGRLSELRGKLQVMEENEKDAASREERLEQAKVVRYHVDAKLKETIQQLEALDPDFLRREEERLNRSISIQKETLQQMEVQIAEAQGVLRSDGADDPHAELLQARASYAAAVEVEKQESRRGDAIKRLHELFTNSQRAINQKVVEPLANRMTDYLTCAFGPEAKLTVEMDDHDSMRLKVHRRDLGEHSFEVLSGGAKEQVAAAARLAMAEILAEEESDRCLPIVFDDAFAYADPQRVQQLQRMLDLAAQRGLQVIVLTCNPADYVALGAKEVRMEAA